MGPGAILAATLLVAVVTLTGLWSYHQGWAVQHEAVTRLREERGERTRRRLKGALGDQLRRTEAGRQLEDRLVAAGLAVTPVDAIATVLATAAATLWLAQMLLPFSLALLATVGSVYAWERYRRYRLNKRTEAFVAQLPELARSLSSAASAGLALSSALEITTTDIDDPARTVLRQVQDELRVGQSVEGAFENLERRMPSREVAVLVATLVIQQRAGGDVVDALKGMAQTLEQRKETAREIRSTLAEATQAGYLVIALGLFIPILMNVVIPGALDAVVSSWGGRVVLVLSAALFATGSLIIRRMTQAIM